MFAVLVAYPALMLAGYAAADSGDPDNPLGDNPGAPPERAAPSTTILPETRLRPGPSGLRLQPGPGGPATPNMTPPTFRPNTPYNPNNPNVPYNPNNPFNP